MQAAIIANNKPSWIGLLSVFFICTIIGTFWYNVKWQFNDSECRLPFTDGLTPVFWHLLIQFCVEINNKLEYVKLFGIYVSYAFGIRQIRWVFFCFPLKKISYTSPFYKLSDNIAYTPISTVGLINAQISRMSAPYSCAGLVPPADPGSLPRWQDKQFTAHLSSRHTPIRATR